MEPRKEFVTIDWTMRILIAIAGFFLTITFLTVNKTANDVSDLKIEITTMQGNYNELNYRVHLLEQSQQPIKK